MLIYFKYFCIFFIFTGLAYSANIDSLEKTLSRSKGNDKLNALSELAWHYKNSSPSKAIAYAQQGLNYAEKQNSKYYLINFNLTLGTIHLVSMRSEKAIHYYSKALSVANKYKDTLSLAYCFYSMGLAYHGQNDLDKAIDYYSKALSIYKNPSDWEMTSSIHLNLAPIYWLSGNFNKAFEHYRIAEKIKIENKDSIGLIYLFNNLGLLYQSNKSYKNAEASFIKMIDLAIALKETNIIATGNINLGLNYAKQENHTKAISYYRKILPTIKKLNIEPLLVNIYNYLGYSLFKTGNYDSALIYVNRSLELSTKSNLKENIVESYSTLHTIYKERRDFESAYKYLEMESELSKQINLDNFNSEVALKTSQLTSELEAKYELNKMNKELDDFKQTEKLNKLVIIFLFLFLFALIVIVIGSYFFLKALRKTNKNLSTAIVELREKDRELRNAISMRDKFFGIIAHDLKGPLGIYMNISGYISKHYKEMSDREIKQFMDDILISTKNINELLDNLLLWSRIYTGKQKPEPTHFRFDFLVNKIIEDNAQYCFDKSIKVNSEIESDLVIVADFTMIFTIIKNLYLNAVKYSHSNSEIDVSLRKNHSSVEFVISDYGVGIPEERQKDLFTYTRYKTYGTNNEASTGLGLVLSYELARLHNALISFESQENEGSTFFLQIPINKKDDE